MEKRRFPGPPDPLGLVERLSAKFLPIKLVDPLKYLTGFEVGEITASAPPGSPLSLKWERKEKP